MGSHNDLAALHQCKATLQNLIPDPGDGETIHVDRDDGVCLLTLAGAGETRLIDSASDIPLGIRLTVVADVVSGGGTCTVEGVTLNAAGQSAEFVVSSSGGTKAWVNGAGSGTGTISGTDLVLNSTNEMNIQFGGVSGLAIDDAAISGHTAAAGVAGKSVFVATQAGGTSGATGVVGGNLTITMGAGAAGDDDGGDAGTLSLVTQAGGSGGTTSGAGGAIRLNSVLGSGGVFVKQAAPTAETAAGTLTAAELMGGLITVTQATGATVAMTLDTGSAMDIAMPAGVSTDEGFFWSLINLSAAAADTATVTAAAGHTLVGVGVVCSAHATTGGDGRGNAGRFFTRRTAANTWITYRV